MGYKRFKNLGLAYVAREGDLDQMVAVRRKSRLPASIQEELVKHFVGGATARAAALLVGVNWHTATLFFPKLREVIARRLDAEALEPLGGEVEIDESYFGGRRKGKRGAALAARSRSSGCSSVAARSMP